MTWVLCDSPLASNSFVASGTSGLSVEFGLGMRRVG